MIPPDLLNRRRDNWRELEQLCYKLEGRRRRLPPESIARFAHLYRSACADLALADAYQISSGTVAFLHQLVARAHNQLYRSRRFDWRGWGHELFMLTPRRLFRDNCLRLALVLFWGVFVGSAIYANAVPDYAERLVGKDQLRGMEHEFSTQLDRKNAELSSIMGGFYIQHNTSIGLECFAMGLLFGIGGIVALVFNAAEIGACFGFMKTTDSWPVFSNFVTAHAPFELTAIVLSAAAGMHLGFAIIQTNGQSRSASLQQAAREAMPAMGAAIVMFMLAAMIEGFLSPTSVPYPVKVAVAATSTVFILFYGIVLGSRPLIAARGSEAAPVRLAEGVPHAT